MNLRLEPSGMEIHLPKSSTVLAAALRAGVPLPNSCRNGTCRTCMCRLLDGQVRYTIDWPGLLAEEKQQGWILPCVAQAMSDLVIDCPDLR